MFKIIQDEPQPECWYCMDISKIEFYGSFNENYNEEITKEEEEVSIIGRVKSA